MLAAGRVGVVLGERAVANDEDLDVVEKARAGFAALIGAEPDEIALTKNVSEGVNIIAASLPWREGDNVVGVKEAGNAESPARTITTGMAGFHICVARGRFGSSITATRAVNCRTRPTAAWASAICRRKLVWR